MEDYLLDPRILVENDSRPADLRSRAGGGGHGDDGGDPSRVGPPPPILLVLEIPKRPALARLEGDRLADVEGAAAAEGDDAVMPARAIDRDPRLGLGLMLEKRLVGSPAASFPAIASRTIGIAASAASVTSSGRSSPSSRQAEGSSAMRPAPKRMAVG
jgi:hypothetical protein